MVIIWTSTVEIEDDAKYPSQYDSTRCSPVTLHRDRQRTCAVPGTIQTSYRLLPSIVLRRGSTEHCVQTTHVIATREAGHSSPSCPRPLLGLSHATTGTDATIIPTTRCALPLVGQQPAVSRQNESQLSSRLTMSFLTKANSGISDVDKRDPFDAAPLAAMIAGARE
ncbi:hypothetical protein QBC32DRAFT_373375 [Pseudoneurospora amorphoporcata]|uniref:Uncharacterized protein n=1 Tax=Pseudoneurospora amorphoporcata TaxID=241081 RepID=A0AAN6SD73_9PEZI|nr:hypothetical protein QBC32DRAFT_373375 [Pseudoneurospora amorphoporcata]